MGALRGAMRDADFATKAFHAHTALKTLELSGNGFTEAAIDPSRQSCVCTRRLGGSLRSARGCRNLVHGSL